MEKNRENVRNYRGKQYQQNTRERREALKCRTSLRRSWYKFQRKLKKKNNPKQNKTKNKTNKQTNKTQPSNAKHSWNLGQNEKTIFKNNRNIGARRFPAQSTQKHCQ